MSTYDNWKQHNPADDAPEPVWSGAKFETSVETPRYFMRELDVVFTIENAGNSLDEEPIVNIERVTMLGADVMPFIQYENLCQHIEAIVSLDQDSYLCSASDFQ